MKECGQVQNGFKSGILQVPYMLLDFSSSIMQILFFSHSCHKLNIKLSELAFTWMELESIMLSEISQMVRDKYHMISPLTGT